MLKEKEQSLALFSDDDLDAIQPTGSPWHPNPADPATVPVPLQTVIVKVEGPYNERDRKLWTFLLHAVFDELGEKPIHSLSVREINSVFRELGGDHNTKWLWESAKRLSKTNVEWETTFDDDRFEAGTSSIFGAVISKKAKQTGVLHFNFPPLLIPIIKQPSRFARLRVHFLMQLSGKYAVTLYEILEGFANRRDGKCHVTIDDLRTWLKVPEKSYKTWKDFRKWVLDPAIKQINDNPDGAGFTVEYTPIRKGRFYHEIVFKLNRSNSRKKIDSLQKANSERGRAREEAKAKVRPHLRIEAIQKAQEATRYVLDMDEMQRQFWGSWESSGRPTPQKGIDAMFIGFCKKKHKEMR